MNFTKINELKPYDLNCNIFDVYSYDGLSMQELLCQFFTKINECIKTSNETIDLAEWLVNEGLKQEVALKLTNWLNDGTLENLINVTLFENLNKKIDNVSLQLNQNAINVKLFGAIGDGVTDDTEAIQNAINSLKVGDRLLIPPGDYLINSSLTLSTNNITIDCLGTLITDANIELFKIENKNNSDVIEGINGNLKVSKKSLNYYYNSIGIKLTNVIESNIKINAINFTTNLKLVGNNNGLSYNTFTIDRLTQGKTNIDFEIVGTGWVNENKFMGGRFEWFSDNDNTGKIHINIKEQSMNNNIFFSPSLENGRDGDIFILCNGKYNTFYSPRLEPTKGLKPMLVIYGEDSYSNTIYSPYTSIDIYTNNELYDNKGYHNKLISRYGFDLDSGIVANCGIKSIVNPSRNPDLDDACITVRNLGTSKKAIKILDKTNPTNEVINLNDDGVIKAKKTELQSGSNTVTLLSIKNINGDEKLTVNGNGHLNLNKQIIKNMSGNSSNCFEVLSIDGTTRITMNGNGNITTTGNITANNITNTYVENEITFVNDKDCKIGDIKINNSKVQIYLGNGIWKTFGFID